MAFVAIDHASILQGNGVSWIKPERLVVILQGKVVFALQAVDDGAAVESSGKTGGDLDRLIMILNGLIILAFVPVGDGAVVEGGGEQARARAPVIDHIGALQSGRSPRGLPAIVHVFLAAASTGNTSRSIVDASKF